MKKFFCCKEMEIFLNNPRDPIEYNPIFREYFIRLDNRPNIITLAYCPWCGSKLPVSLRESYFDILEKEYQIETDLGEYKECSDIPADFRNDKWWRARKISLFSFDQLDQIEQIKQSERKTMDEEIDIMKSEWLQIIS